MWRVTYERRRNTIIIYIINPTRYFDSHISTIKEPNWFDTIVLKRTWEDKIRIALDKAQKIADKWNLEELREIEQEQYINEALEKIRQEKGVKSLK